MKKTLLFSILFATSLFLHANARTAIVDSINIVLRTAKNDTNKVNILNVLSLELQDNFEKSNQILQEALSLGQTLNYKNGIANSFNHLGNLFRNNNEYDQALYFHFKALEIRKNIGDKEKIASSFNNIGLAYYAKGNFVSALDFHFKALKLNEETGDKYNQGLILNNIGNIYNNQGNYEKALEYFLRSLKIKEEQGDKEAIAIQLHNISMAYYVKGKESGNNEDFEKGLECLSESLKKHKAMEKKYAVAHNLVGMGLIYFEQQHYDKTIQVYIEALHIYEALENKWGIAATSINLSTAYLQQKQYDKSILFSEKGLLISKEINANDMVKEACEALSSAYEKNGNALKALKFYKLFIAARDSIYNEANTKKLVQAEMNYEFEKKEQEVKFEQERKESIHKAELEKQTMQRNGFIAGFSLMLTLAGVSYRSYRHKRKAHKEIALQKSIVEEKNKNILDSINYAKRIQEALLKEEEHVSPHLPEHFILFQPKDIVSGDFYWSFEKQGYLYLAAIDCTGHGVPGAFMSMLGIAFLNEITAAEKLLTPSEILERLREKVIKELSQTGKTGESKDGMDLSLIRLNYSTKEIQWAGANNPLWVIRKSELGFSELRPNKQPIGFHFQPQPFTLHYLQLKEGDTMYLFTDGYADQFGGPRGKKFKYRQMQELILSLQDKPMKEQKEILDKKIEKWRGDLEQVDDILVIGVRV